MMLMYNCIVYLLYYFRSSGGMSCHYFLLTPGGGRSLVLRMGEPGLYCPQSVAVYNSISVTAFVQTDQDQALNPEAFKLLLSIVREDLQNRNLPMPKYLLRYTAHSLLTILYNSLYSHKELRGSGWHGWISNMDELRTMSGMTKPDNIGDFLGYATVPIQSHISASICSHVSE